MYILLKLAAQQLRIRVVTRQIRQISVTKRFLPGKTLPPSPGFEVKEEGEGGERFDIHRERTSFGRVGARSAKKSDVSEVCRLTNGRSPRSEASPFKLEVIVSEPLTVRTIEKKKRRRKKKENTFPRSNGEGYSLSNFSKKCLCREKA